MTAPTRHDQETWLSVQDASAMLGVSPATLRRWSAAGEVEAFTTPGGHRRFALTTLQALLPHPTYAPARLTALGESPERMVRVLRRRMRAASPDSTWLRGLPDGFREELRAGGRDLTSALVEHLDAATREARQATLARAEAAAAEQALRAHAHGAQLGEMVTLFLHFRAQFVSELASATIRHGLDSADAIALVTRGGEVADRILAAFVVAFEEASPRVGV